METHAELSFLTLPLCNCGIELYEHAGMQPISVIAPYLPTALHRKRDAARKKIGEIFKDIISKRRASGLKGNDILQTFIDGKYERAYGGRPLTESEITGLLIAALFAGMHTSTITSAWTGLFLSSHQASWDACVEEQRRIIAEHGEDLSIEVLGKMEILHACITEALRMYPPLIMMLRYAKQPFTVTGMARTTHSGATCLYKPARACDGRCAFALLPHSYNASDTFVCS